MEITINQLLEGKPTIIKGKEYVRGIGGGNYNLDDAKVIKKLKK